MSTGKTSEKQRRELLKPMHEAVACQHARTVDAMVLDFRSMRKGLHDIIGLRYGGDCYDTDSRAQGWLETLIIIQAQLESLTSKETPEKSWWRLSKALPALCRQVGQGTIRERIGEHRAHYDRLASKLHRDGDPELPKLIRSYDIAHAHQITLAELREAGATKRHLTSIDPESRQERNQKDYEKRRAKTGAVPQSERTKTRETDDFALDVGCSGRTVRDKLKSGKLLNWLEKRGWKGDFQKVHHLISLYNDDEDFGENRRAPKVARPPVMEPSPIEVKRTSLDTALKDMVTVGTA
ncbi:hypothetical protein [Methylobacterium aquaticum]|uniref:hypothetical protein n=1 Tax=Methylobacterium aquaticum TaxID=270351 RepID=UPI001931F19D|nr:hypothetical protein [Methylobacterium aquaticum]QRE74225.1 hypothetical protein F1D61_11945 [Methylobacterium aquaticum]